MSVRFQHERPDFIETAHLQVTIQIRFDPLQIRTPETYAYSLVVQKLLSLLLSRWGHPAVSVEFSPLDVLFCSDLEVQLTTGRPESEEEVLLIRKIDGIPFLDGIEQRIMRLAESSEDRCLADTEQPRKHLVVTHCAPEVIDMSTLSDSGQHGELHTVGAYGGAAACRRIRVQAFLAPDEVSLFGSVHLRKTQGGLIFAPAMALSELDARVTPAQHIPAAPTCALDGSTPRCRLATAGRYTPTDIAARARHAAVSRRGRGGARAARRGASRGRLHRRLPRRAGRSG